MLSSQRFCTLCGAANRQEATFCFACGQSLSASDEVNSPINLSSSTSRLLKDRYRMLSRLGSGGMGAVNKAEDTLFNQRLVAIKEMSQQGLNARQRQQAAVDFKREAYMLANLRHQGLPTIYDYFSDEGQWYLVMEFIEGETLENRLNNTAGWLPIRKALAIGIQLCAVLDYLHTRQPPIIFRDLKPANIMLTPKEQVVLIDFGIARHFKPGQLKDTVSFGSAGYAAPEQYGKTQTTPRSDIYSLGVILHQCLSGNDPSANSPTPFDFPPLNLHGQFAPPSLYDMVRQMLAMNPANRPENMQVVLQQLTYIERRLDRLQTQAYIPLAPFSSSPTSPTSPLTPSSTPSTSPFTPSSPSSPSSTSPFTPSPAPSLFSKPVVQKPIPERPVVPLVAPPPKSSVPQATTEHVTEHYLYSSLIRAITLAPNGSVLALGDDHGKITTWDIHRTTIIAEKQTHTYAITALAWSPKKEFIASIDTNNLLIVSSIVARTKIGENTFRYRTQIAMLTSIAWSPDGEYFACGDSRGVITIRAVANGQHINQYSGHTAPVLSLSWSSDGNFIASGDQAGQIHLWQVDTLKLRAMYKGQGPINTVAISPDSRSLIAGDETGHVSLWSLTTKQLTTIHTLNNPQSITVCAWSSNGQYVATGSSDTTIQVWRADTGTHIITHNKHKAAILDLVWLADGKNVLSMDVDNHLHIWKIR
jgi:serine/threonine protein kinase